MLMRIDLVSSKTSRSILQENYYKKAHGVKTLYVLCSQKVDIVLIFSHYSEVGIVSCLSRYTVQNDRIA